MHFTVGSASGAKDSSSLFDMGHELSMLKAALLYADEVKLCSVGASIMSGFVEFHELTDTQIVPLVKKFGWSGLDDDQRRKFDLVYGVGGTRAERRGLGGRQKAKAKKELQGVVSECRDRFGEEIEEWIETNKADGLQRAVSSGVVKIHPFTHLDAFGLLERATSDDPFEAQQTIDDIVFEYVEQAYLAIEGGESYPMFDADVAGLVDEMVERGLIAPTPAAEKRGRQGGLAGDLLQRLPRFDTASVDEVLDIRESLEKPLGGFRQAITEFSATIESAAWDKHFGEETNDLFREKVEPRVRDLEEAVKENASLARLLWDTAKHGATTGTVVAVLGTTSGLFDIAQIALTSGASPSLMAGGVAAMLRAGMDKRERRRELEGNQLFFYYAAGEALGGGRPA